MNCEQVVDEVVRAVQKFARSGTAAVIVFERSSLDDVVRERVPMNAEINTKVLLSNFENPRTREGAVIVHGSRVVARSCRLPATTADKITGGAARRGALGLVEQTDAVVVTVSERDGRVELGVDGALQPASPSGLAQRLLPLLQRDAS